MLRKIPVQSLGITVGQTHLPAVEDVNAVRKAHNDVVAHLQPIINATPSLSLLAVDATLADVIAKLNEIIGILKTKKIVG